MKQLHLISAALALHLLCAPAWPDQHDHEKEAPDPKPKSKTKATHEEPHGDEKEHEHSKKEAHDDHAAEEGHSDHEEEGEEGGSGVGPGKAITAASKTQGIQLSEFAVKTLGLKTAPIVAPSNHRLSPGALVKFQNEAGVYRLRGGWFKLIEGKLLSLSATEALFQSNELRPGDQIVIEGVPLLRVAELEAWGGSGDGHGH